MDSLLPLAADIGARLKARGETVAISESSAGGLISAAILAAPGASAWYRGGGVIYTPQAFRGLLGLGKADLGDMRSSTEPYARLLARTIAGNGYGDAAGHTCVALAGPGKFEVSRTLETGLKDRPENMRLFAREALELLRAALD